MFFCPFIFAERVTVIEDQNSYNGKTYLIIFDEEEQKRATASQLIEYFDSENIIVKRIYTSTKTVCDETGIIEQIQYYQNNTLIKYEMLFTDDYNNVYGYNRLIEEVDTDDLVIRKIWYYDNILLDVSSPATEKFNFYNLDYVHDEFYVDYTPNPNGDVIMSSAKYFSLRSLLQFDTELIEIDPNDIALIDAFMVTYNFEEIGQQDKFSQYYSKKVRVYSDDNEYWLFVQKDLEQYVLGQYATARYYPIAKNEELFLICVGFYDVKM